MHCAVIHCALLGLASAGCSPSRATWPVPLAANAPAPPPGYSAIVGRDRARFTLPVAAESVYVWWDSAGRTENTTYAWDVGVWTPEKRFYLVGWRLPAPSNSGDTCENARQHPPPPGTQRGRLTELLRFGCAEVREANELTAMRFADEVAVQPEGDQLTIEVWGTRAMHVLFGHRPSHVAFWSKFRGETDGPIYVEVHYVDSRAPEQSRTDRLSTDVSTSTTSTPGMSSGRSRLVGGNPGMKTDLECRVA